MARFYPIFSGSSGNSTYMGTANEGILIDAGMSAKQMMLELDRAGIPIASIKAIFITHEHTDHIKGVRVFASKNNIKVYASHGTLNSLIKSGNLSNVAEYDVIGEEGISFDTLRITPFHTSHDAAESTGYRVEFSDGRTAAVATDTGIVTPEVLRGIRKADLVLLESNHDPRMLKYGPYPFALKQRIASELGHLSNTDCAAAALYLMENGTTRFFLGHLSRENNTPEKARACTFTELSGAGATEGTDFLLEVAAPRGNGKITRF